MLLFKNAPALDLHGLDRIYASIKVKEFLNDNYKLRNERLVIIHGIGKQILKKEVHDILKRDKRILEYKIDFFNIGATYIKLNIKN